MQEPVARPARTLTTADAVFVIVGIVIGAGIFKSPSLVAANSGSELAMLLMWVAGGVVALIGALCYAELASTYPSTGGDYHFLLRAFGRGPAFLFAWARLSVMQTGSIALLAFVFGDYATEILPLGPYSTVIYAALVVIALTGVNLLGIREGKGTQRLFTSLEVAGVLIVIGAGLLLAGSLTPETPAAAAQSAAPEQGGASPAIGLAMVFVLLTFGGWNEGAYVSAEVRGSGRAPIARALLLSICLITVLYLLVNLAYARVLGLDGMAASEAVAADAMQRVLGEHGANFVSLLVAISALTSANATIITGARSNHALGNDFALFRFLGHWSERGSTPRNALLVQGVIALLLVLFGAIMRSGFETMVEYTAPVFWFFFLLTGLALFRLRRRDPGAERPFRVPLYPFTPLLFCASSAYMLWSSLNYTGVGALVGVAALIAGLPILWFMLRRGPAVQERGDDDETKDRRARLAREHRVVD